MSAPGRPRRILAAFRRHPILTGLLLFLVGFPLWSTYGQDCRTGVLHFRSTVPIAELRVDVSSEDAERPRHPGPNRTLWRGRPDAGRAVNIPYLGDIYSIIGITLRTEEGNIFVDPFVTEVIFYGGDVYVAFDGTLLHVTRGRPADWPFDLRGWVTGRLGLRFPASIGDALSCADEDEAHWVL